jgi:hypothetical protein
MGVFAEPSWTPWLIAKLEEVQAWGNGHDGGEQLVFPRR